MHIIQIAEEKWRLVSVYNYFVEQYQPANGFKNHDFVSDALFALIICIPTSRLHLFTHHVQTTP